MPEQGSKSRVLVCYSTQSGTSQTLAEKFGWGLNQATSIPDLCHNENISVLEASEDLKALFESYDIAVFFISSYGDGEPCNDAVATFDVLRNFKGEIKAQYSIFGCGNSYYDQYQAAALELKRLLDALGMKQFGDFGYGDEAKNAIMDDYDSWCFDYDHHLGALLNLELKEAVRFEPMYCAVETQGTMNKVLRPPYQELNPYPSDIDMASFETFGDRYIHFTVNLHKTESRLKYQSGDHLGIYPTNKADDVRRLIDILGLRAGEYRFKITPVNRIESNRWINQEYHSYVEFFTHHVEINGMLSRKFIKDLSNYFVTSGRVKEQLQELVFRKDDFRARVLEKKLTFVRLFDEFGISKDDYKDIPVSFLLENFGFLKPRLFSISSSETHNSSGADVLMSLVEDDAHSFVGVCSNTVRSIFRGGADNRVSVFTVKSKFKLPLDLSRPLIFVGAGSGIAPYRGFLQDICSQPHKLRKVSKIVVYFGLRCVDDEHHIYRADFKRFQELLGDRLEVKYAVSGDPNNKVYVQDLMALDGERNASYLRHQNGHVFVCGSANGMAQAVKKVLVDILSDGHDLRTGDQYVQYLSSLGRYREDVW